MTLKLDDATFGIEKMLRRYESMVEDAIREISKMGMRFPGQPMVKGKPFVPEVPTGPDGKPSLSHLSNRDLSDLNVQFLAYHDYVLTQFKIKKITKLTLEKRLRQAVAYVRALHAGTAADKSDSTLTDPRVQDADVDFTQASIEAELTEAILEACDADMKVISREVAIREQEFGLFQRDSNIRSKKRSNYRSSDFGIEEAESDEEFLKKKHSKVEKDPR